MGAVAALLVIVVGDVQIAVYVVITKGDFCTDIQPVCCQFLVGDDLTGRVGIAFVDIELL